MLAFYHLYMLFFLLFLKKSMKYIINKRIKLKSANIKFIDLKGADSDQYQIMTGKAFIEKKLGPSF